MAWAPTRGSDDRRPCGRDASRLTRPPLRPFAPPTAARGRRRTPTPCTTPTTPTPSAPSQRSPRSSAARTATGAWAAPVVTVYDFASSTGFTTANGVGGTASITAGVARLSNPSGTQFRVAGSYNGPSITRALPAPQPVDVAVRLAVGPSVSGSQVTLEISDAASAGTRVCALVTDYRSVLFYRNDTNSTLATAAGAFASFTGQEWVRVRAIAGFVLVYYGTGVAGALPTAWTQVGSPLALSAYWSHVTMGLVVVDTASTSTIDLDDLTILSAPVASL